MQNDYGFDTDNFSPGIKLCLKAFIIIASNSFKDVVDNGVLIFDLMSIQVEFFAYIVSMQGPPTVVHVGDSASRL